MIDKQAILLDFCRLCKSKNLKLVIDLGESPPPNTFLSKSELNNPEPIFPLRVNFCQDCNQVQLSHIVSPELMYRNNYAYVSSTSKVMVEHFENYAKTTFTNLQIESGDFVVEMGSNDGTLLKHFKNLGCRVLGVDPAKEIADKATNDGVKTLPEFFNSKIAKEILIEYGQVKIVSANNVFAHINDVHDVVDGVKKLLSDDGVFIVEFPYLIDLLDNNVFDQIYSEHLSYPAVVPFEKFFNSFGMEIFDCIRTPVQGGSIRLYVQKKGGKYKKSPSVNKFKNLELKNGLSDQKTYLIFAKKLKNTKKELISLLTKIKKENKQIIGYGAPGRSTTLLNYFGINTNFLNYIVDDNPLKIGLYTPGTHIPILEVSEIQKSNPNYILILSWNYSKPIMEKLYSYKNSGGNFIIPIPTPKVV